MADLILSFGRVPVDQNPHAAGQASRHRDLLGIQEGHVLPPQIPGRPRRKGRRKVWRSRKERAGYLVDSHIVGLHDVSQ
jgi:hypothetical protein